MPEKVEFCKKCVISNQKPNTVVEFKQSTDNRRTGISFNKDGVCSACEYNEKKKRLTGKKERINFTLY